MALHLEAVWTDISRSVSAFIGAASDQRRFDGDVPMRCPRIGTHLVGRLDKALRRRALHPRQAHVEASCQAEGAPFGTEIDLGVDRVIGRQRDLHGARGELHRRLEARGPAGREELLRVGAGARAAGPRQPDLEAAVGAARHAGAPACGVGLGGVQHFLESVHNILLHEEPRRLDALRSSVAIGEVAWLGTEILCASRPVDTGAASIMTWPLSPVSAACAPSTRRTVAVCGPPAEDEKRTRYAMSATASPFVSILSSYNALGANGSRVVDPAGFTTAEGWTFMIRIDLSASLGLGKAYKSVRSRRASPCGKPKSGPE